MIGRAATLLACLAALKYLQEAAQGDADAKTYRLSMDNLRKLLEVQGGLAAARSSLALGRYSMLMATGSLAGNVS